MNRIRSWLSTDLDGVIRFFLLTGIFLTVTLFDLKSLKEFDMVKWSALWCLGGIAVGLWAVQVIRGQAIRVPSPSTRAGGLFLAAFGVATLFSVTRIVSFFGEYQRQGGFLSALMYVALFTLIVNLYRGRPEQTREVLFVLGEASIVVVAYIYLQWLGLDPINWVRSSGKVTKHITFGTLGNANFAGGFLGLLVPWLWYAFHHAKARWVRTVVVLYAVAHMWALWLTSARNGLVAAAFGVGALLLMYHRMIPSWTKIAAAVAAGAVVIVGVLVVWHPGSDKPPGALARARVLRSETLAVRGYWWLAGMKTFASRPITGTGPETFVREYPRRLSPKAARIPDSEAADKPHNVFVEYAVGTGVLGLGAYLFLVVGVLRRGVRRRVVAPGDEKLLLTAFIATTAGYLGQAFFSIDMVPLAMAGWVALAGVAALSEPRAVPPTSSVTSSTRRNLSIAGVLALTAAVFALGVIRLQADHYMKSAQIQTKLGFPVSDIVDSYQRAIALAPLEPLYRGVVADFLEKHANAVDDRAEKRRFLETSVRTFERLNELQPGMHLWKMTLAQAMADLAAAGGSVSFDEADVVFGEAQRQGPYDWRVPVAWGTKLNLRADVTKRTVFRCLARDQFARAVALRPSETKPWLGLGETLSALGRLSRAAEAMQNAVNNAVIEQDQVNARQGLESALTKVARVRSNDLEVKRISCS